MSTPPLPSTTSVAESSKPPTSIPDAAPAPKAPEKLTGWRSALEHTGIPQSWIQRPRLPSRKMMLFIGTVSGLVGAYYYDRRQCKLIRQSYIDKVKHLAEEPMRPWELPRKIKVYACKWPGDDAAGRSSSWFKSNVRPILVAAAIDYEIKNGNEYGALARLISNEIRDQRRIELGLDPPPSELTPPGPPRPADWKQQREMAGGTIVIGRHTLKEYMSGLSRGWTRPLEKEDEDTVVARELENDGHFDEPATTLETVMEEADPSLSDPTFSTTPSKPPQLIYSPMQLKMPTPSKPSPPPQAAPIPPELNAPPSEIPLQPPLTLVPYTSLLGFLNIPFMIVGYFNKRKDVLMGAEAAYRAIVNQTRPFEGPSPDSKGDLSFDAHAEVNYRKDFNNIPKNVTSARKSYYDALPKKLEIARALARNEREPTKDEKKYPPPTEVELRAERLKKEKRWRNELDGFEILNREVGVAWDERMRDALTVTVDGELPPPPPPPFQSYDP